MEIITVNSDNIESNIIQDIFTFCKKCELETTQPAYENMMYTNWENKPNTLLYALCKTDRFSKENGIFSFVYDNNEIVASSGSYKSDFDPNIIIGGVRAWKLPKYRGSPIVAQNIMPAHIEWAKNNNGKIFALTFNEYNYKTMKALNRSGKYSKSKDRLFLFGTKRDPFYQDLEELSFKVLIKGTEQYVLYKKLDQNYIPSWPIVS